MLLAHQPLKVVVTGKSGSGKTTYFQKLIENGWQTYWKTIFLYDWQGELSFRLKVPSITKTSEFPEVLKTSGFICFDPSLEFEGDYETGLDFFAKWAFEVSKKCTSEQQELCPPPRLFGCDELQLITSNSGLSGELQTVLQTGRRWGLDFAVVSQQLNELDNVFRNQMTERVTFQHEDPYVLSVMRDWGFDPDEVSRLAPGSYLWRDDKGGFRRGRIF